MDVRMDAEGNGSETLMVSGRGCETLAPTNFGQKYTLHIHTLHISHISHIHPWLNIFLLIAELTAFAATLAAELTTLFVIS